LPFLFHDEAVISPAYKFLEFAEDDDGMSSLTT